MKLRLFATVCCLAISGSLLEGCAGNPTRGPESAAAERVDISRLPQLDVPGASSAELRSLAMGLARSKGWDVVKSPKDQVIAQHPLEPEALAALVPNADDQQMRGAVLEVTSYFVDQSSGTQVASRAALVAPGTREKGPRRIDCTEQYQATLMESLASLRDAWPRARSKIAHATPPTEGWKDAWAETNKPAVADAPAATPSSAFGEAVAARATPAPSAFGQDTYSDGSDGSDAADTGPTDSAPVPTPRVAQTQPATTRPAEPRRAGAAPVVDASSGGPGTRPTPRPATPQPTRIPSSANMMQLPPSASVRQGAASGKAAAATSVATASTKKPTTVTTAQTKTATTATATKTATPTKPTGTPAKPQTATVAKTPAKTTTPQAKTAAATAKPKAQWSASAEQFARKRGCKVSAKGGELIDARRDGEVHKINCTGSDSVLVKCQNGTCKGLL